MHFFLRITIEVVSVVTIIVKQLEGCPKQLLHIMPGVPTPPPGPSTYVRYAL